MPHRWICLEEAAWLWGQAHQVRRLANCPDSVLRAVLAERHLTVAQQALGPERYETSFQAGNQLSHGAILEGLRQRNLSLPMPLQEEVS